MNYLNKIHRLIMRDDEVGVSKILLEFGFKWFMFGVLVGATAGVVIEGTFK